MATAPGIQDSYAEWKTSTALAGLGQALVPQSDTNKHELLSEVAQLTHSDESRARVAAILARLKELNPEVVRQFHPKLNALSDLNLRMIRPASASPEAAGRVASYIAVSYCWHYPQWPLAAAATPIAPGWEISEPMMKAVMRLCQPDEGVWLDKLCINQDDAADKAAHIGVMDAIYRSARRTAILLEDIQLSKEEEKAGLIYRGFYEDLVQAVQRASLEGEQKARFIDAYIPSREKELRDKQLGHVLDPARAFTAKVLTARWFTRGWCAHECRMNKHLKDSSPLFMCFGADGRVLSFEFRFIHYMSVYLNHSDRAPNGLAGIEQSTDVNHPDPGMLLSQLWFKIQRLLPERRVTVSAMQHLVTILPFDCLKKGDLMSIALNTAGIPLYFDGSGCQTVQEVIWTFTVLVLAANDLVPLVMLGPPLRVPSAGQDIVSWAIHPNQPILDDEVQNPLPGSITATTSEYIELDLLVFESLPLKASRESQDRAARLIEEHSLDAVADALLSALPEDAQAAVRAVVNDKRFTELHSVRNRLISLALDSGLDWTLAFPSVMRQTTSTFMYGTMGDHAHPGLEAAVHAFLALFTPDPAVVPSTDSEPQPPQPPRTLTPGQLATLHRALTTLLDPRLLSFTPSPRRLPLPPALGTAALTQAVSCRSYVAVPAALAHLPGWHTRAWAIEPFDPAAAPRMSVEDEIEMAPVVSSDVADWRAPRDDARGTWRRVYGAEKYPWGRILEVLKKRFAHLDLIESAAPLSLPESPVPYHHQCPHAPSLRRRCANQPKPCTFSTSPITLLAEHNAGVEQGSLGNHNRRPIASGLGGRPQHPEEPQTERRPSQHGDQNRPVHPPEVVVQDDCEARDEEHGAVEVDDGGIGAGEDGCIDSFSDGERDGCRAQEAS
ncbi:hypothetical protein N657DRAFT_674114 [Parathielavia appendiculata]|uniref:Heterokaryon incompatibility domain-containing protein n=1 Tax=Parathielavia appendiculata TaxID=2587402 RepID=A0AAN6Z0T7_9PEZI|nr:hypothetical protein N657DRAFT_674114 [Parathielavia appendiculata]